MGTRGNFLFYPRVPMGRWVKIDGWVFPSLTPGYYSGYYDDYLIDRIYRIYRIYRIDPIDSTDPIDFTNPICYPSGR